jgi:hypothetical protein
MTISADQFLRPFLLQTLPRGFVASAPSDSSPDRAVPPWCA